MANASAAVSYTILIDNDSNGTTQAFAVYHDSETAANALLQVTEGLSLTLGNTSDPLFEVRGSTHTVYMSDDDWIVRHNGASTSADFFVVSNQSVYVDIGEEGGTGSKFVVKNESSDELLKVDRNGNVAVRGGIELTQNNTSIVTNGALEGRGVVGIDQLVGTSQPPGLIRLEDTSTGKWYLWVSTAGVLRIASTPPSNGNQSTFGNPV